MNRLSVFVLVIFVPFFMSSGCAHSSRSGQLKGEKESIDNMLQEVAHGKMNENEFVESYVNMIEGGKFEE